MALALGLTLTELVFWGSLVGIMLPFLLRRLGLGSAISSAPFVATHANVTRGDQPPHHSLMILKGTG